MFTACDHVVVPYVVRDCNLVCIYNGDVSVSRHPAALGVEWKDACSNVICFLICKTKW